MAFILVHDFCRPTTVSAPMELRTIFLDFTSRNRLEWGKAEVLETLKILRIGTENYWVRTGDSDLYGFTMGGLFWVGSVSLRREKIFGRPRVQFPQFPRHLPRIIDRRQSLRQ
jgi:hypothetical protein